MYETESTAPIVPRELSTEEVQDFPNQLARVRENQPNPTKPKRF